VLQKISDPRLTTCPACGQDSYEKQVTAAGFRLKGSGWYETDFKSDKENKRNLAGAEKEEAKSETKSETKSEAPKAEAAKPDSKPAADKPAASPVKRPAARAKAKAKSARKPRR
jgi:predicted nucleic acid-binding Zn ribbon protein